MVTSARKAVRPVSSRAVPMHGVGVIKGNPTRCFVCRREIRPGERWVKHTSTADPKYGAYSIIVHEKCEKAS